MHTSQKSLLPNLRIIAADIKLAHSVFALPFAILAVFLAKPHSEPTKTTLHKLALVIICMILARTWAMLVNRLADAQIDAKNPRTKNRPFANKQISTSRGWLIALTTATLFTATAASFWPLFQNPWPTFLAIPTLLWIAFYSLTKRFTALCHIFLGGALAASPIAAAIAVNPAALTTTPAIWFIALMVLLWVAGFDIIYALQDIDFDKKHNIKSIPAKIGHKAATHISQTLHLAATAALLLAWYTDPRLNTIYLAATTLTATLLITEHIILAKRGKAGLNMAFFTLNGIVSILLGTAATIDLYL